MTTQENMIAIEVYKDEYQAQVIELILDIQQNEFKVPIISSPFFATQKLPLFLQ